MPTKTADATWSGPLMTGKGHVKSQSGKLDADLGWKSRAENEPGTNPEELIGAAHAACFSMALSHMLSEGGHPPTKIETHADVEFNKVGDGFAITKITLKTKGTVPGIDEKTFKETAEKAKGGCPVSKALASVPISMEATFVK